MNLTPRIRKIVNNLDVGVFSEHLEIRHANLNPEPGFRGWGIRGVRSMSLIAHYIDAFERLYQVITGPVLDYPQPRTNSSGKTMAYVFHIPDLFPRGNPFTTHDSDGVPFIGLSCRNSEPTFQAAMHRAAAEIVHEATHVFNWTVRPFGTVREADWVWFNEATCVFMERYVLPSNPDAVRFFLNWSDQPEVPLDAAPYEAGMFAAYLAKRFGPGLITRTWKSAGPVDTPFDTLNTIFTTASPLHHSPSKDFFPIFGDYAFDSYFLWDHTNPAFAPDIFLRFGMRALSEYSLLAPGMALEIDGAVDHLACRYYRFDVETGVSKVRWELSPKPPAGQVLDARIARVTRAHERRDAQRLLSATPGGPLVAEITVNSRDTDHLVLMVANCGIRPRRENPNIPHDDNQEYRIKVSAA